VGSISEGKGEIRATKSIGEIADKEDRIMATKATKVIGGNTYRWRRSFRYKGDAQRYAKHLREGTGPLYSGPDPFESVRVVKERGGRMGLGSYWSIYTIP